MSRRATVVLTTLLVLGCGDPSSSPGNGEAGAGGSAGALNSGGGGASGGGGVIDIADASPDAEVSASGSGGGTISPPGCPEPTPIPVDAEHPIVIQSVHFSRREVVLRNASQTTQTLAGGRRGWQWCNIPDYWNIQLLEEDIVLEPGGTYKFRLIKEDGSVRALYPGDEGEVNEIAIISAPGGFMTGDLMPAFVSWGTGSTLLGSRESVATQGGVWIFGERVEIEPGHAGFVITGAADRGDGYTSVPGRCLPASP